MRSARAGKPSSGFGLLVSALQEVINTAHAVADMASAALAVVGTFARLILAQSGRCVRSLRRVG
jgi:hypothetical protein